MTINNNNSTSVSTSNTSDIIATSNDTPPSLAPSSSLSQFTPPSNNNNGTLYIDYGNSVNGSGYNNEGSTTSFIIGIAVVMLFMISSLIGNWYIHGRTQNEDNNSNNNNFHLSSRTTAMGSGIQLLSHENCIELYNTTFDSNGNQLILQQKHIFTKTMKGNNNDNGKSNENGNNTSTNAGSGTEGVVEQKNRSESFVDIELGGDDNGNGNGIGNDESSSIYLSFESDRNKLNQLDWSSSNRSSILTTNTKSVRLDHKGNKNTTTMMNNGTCIICLEEFVQGDMIVWSNDSACHHIYHKECMVHYLAKNCTQRKKGTNNCVLDLITYDNPCPTCRRPNYCLESLLQIVSLLSSIQPQSSTPTTTRTTSMGNNNDDDHHDDDDDDNDEILDEVAAAITTVAIAAVVIETTTNEE